MDVVNLSIKTISKKIYCLPCFFNWKNVHQKHQFAILLPFCHMLWLIINQFKSGFWSLRHLSSTMQKGKGADVVYTIAAIVSLSGFGLFLPISWPQNHFAKIRTHDDFWCFDHVKVKIKHLLLEGKSWYLYPMSFSEIGALK